MSGAARDPRFFRERRNGSNKLPLKPIKKLQIKTESKDGSSTSESFLAEADGKLVIPVPSP